MVYPSYTYDYVVALKGSDYATLSGLSYRLTECGVTVQLGFEDGKHALKVRRAELPNAIEVFEETGDELTVQLANVLKKKYFKKTK